MKAAYGRAFVKHIPSRRISQIIVEVPDEHHVGCTSEFHDRDVLVNVAGAELKGAYGLISGHLQEENHEETEENQHNNADKNADKIEDKKGGQLAKLAGMWCKDVDFIAFLGISADKIANPEELAADTIRKVCGCRRSELDHNPEAAKIFHEKFRIPYKQYLLRTQP